MTSPAPGANSGETEDAVAVGGDQGLVESTTLGEGPGAEDVGCGDFREPVGDPAPPRLRLAQADPRQLWVGKQAERHETAGRRSVDAGEVVADHTRTSWSAMCVK
jgi:hypothetical protein